VGVLSALIVAVGAAAALPAGWAARAGGAAGRPALMAAGGLCLAATGGAFLVVGDGFLGTWAGIVPLLSVYGLGRGVWVREPPAASPHPAARARTRTRRRPRDRAVGGGA
jgi:hypothetical protein